MNTGHIFIKYSGRWIISITKDALFNHLLSKGIFLLRSWHLCFSTNHKVKTFIWNFLCTVCQINISSVQSLSHVQLLATPLTAASQASLSITNFWSLLKLMSIKSVMSSNHLILCCPFLLPSIFPSIRVFSSESILCIRWPKYWSFSFSISPFNEYSGLIFFRVDWLDPLAVQGNLKSLLQHYSSKESILQRSAFSIVQLSHPYMTTGETMDLTRQTFVGKAYLCFLMCCLGWS